jgi:hypothetical protein
MSNGKKTRTRRESNNVGGVLIARILVDENDPEMKERYSNSRAYNIIHNLKDQPTTLEFSKSLSVDDIIYILRRVIAEFQHEGFDTPNALVPVVPADKEGEYKVPDGFSPSKS